MTTSRDLFEDLVITFKPDITLEEERQFIEKYARVIYAIARHVVESQSQDSSQAEELPTIEC